MTSSDSADLALMRASMLLESDPAAAASLASDVLARAPEHDEAKLLLAAACRRLGDAAKSIGVLESLCAAHPGSPVMQLELGRAYAAAGRGTDAMSAFQRAVEFDAAFADGWRELAAQRFLAGDTVAGDRAYLAYSRLAPDPPDLFDAHVAVTANRLDAADGILRAHLRRSPRDAVALRLLADVAERRGDSGEAEKCLNACLDLTPGDAAARHELARLLYGQERTAEALPLIDRLLAAEPHNTDYLGLKAQSLRLAGRTEEAIALMQRVVAEHPGDEQMWLVFGYVLRGGGEQAQAIEAYRRALAARPGFGEGYWALANLKIFRFSEDELRSMQEAASGSASGSPPGSATASAAASVSGSGRIHLEYALGKALEDAGQFEPSFEHYSRGAALKRATMAYDPAATSDHVRRSKALYTADFFAERASFGNERPDPIFIVGMPRSGSTLLEQILASHSQVEGTRELPHVPAIVREFEQYPEHVAGLGAPELAGLAARYLEKAHSHLTLGLPRFVDKMLGNSGHIGLIHLMFPRAAIIDARRHPIGCSFSCYKQLFARGMNFSYELGELGRYYRDYADLMDHIDTALPGRVHRVHYEQLVADPETEVRRLLEYCGLPFEAGCLRFYENRRIAQTISSEQVRQPIYSDAVDQWRRFEPWLAPLKEALGDVVERYPATRTPG